MAFLQWQRHELDQTYSSTYNGDLWSRGIAAFFNATDIHELDAAVFCSIDDCAHDRVRFLGSWSERSTGPYTNETANNHSPSVALFHFAGLAQLESRDSTSIQTYMDERDQEWTADDRAFLLQTVVQAMNRSESSQNVPYGYSEFDNGIAIRPWMRHAYARVTDRMKLTLDQYHQANGLSRVVRAEFKEAFHSNPFCSASHNGAPLWCGSESPRRGYFLDWLLSGPHDQSVVDMEGSAYSSDLEQQLWSSASLKRKFPDYLGDDFPAFKSWLESKAVRNDTDQILLAVGDTLLWHQWLRKQHMHRANPTLYHNGCTNATEPLGVNVLGGHTRIYGIGKSSAIFVNAFAQAGIPVNAIEYYNGGHADFEHVAAHTRGVHLTRSASEPVNLYVANADCTPDILLKIPPQVFRHKYNIGYWAWELDVFPHHLMKHLKVYDEIWVPSRFVADSIQTTSEYDGTVIRVLPIPVQEPTSSIDGSSSSREVELLATIPDTSFVFLVTFDFWSMQERKNPLAAVRAFMHAFPFEEESSSDIYMVVKSTNCNATTTFARYHSYLETLALNHTRILFVPWQLSDEALGSLQQRADCYVSLHRGEGYGMNILEALSKGKAVIATNYSGNVDFFSVMKDFVGLCMFPISYDLVTIKHTLGPFQAGNHWAEPHHESAVDAMRKVVTSKCSERSREISNLARSRYGKSSIGSRAKKYLEEARANIAAKVCPQ
jgi:glycosyltransferase involved in cell wall biosynthesis